MAFGRDPALVIAVGKPKPPGGAGMEQGGPPQQEDANQLSPEDEQTLQDGVSPEAADVLRRVLPPECQHIVEALGPEGEAEEGMEGEQEMQGMPDYGNDHAGPPRPMTRLGRM